MARRLDYNRTKWEQRFFPPSSPVEPWQPPTTVQKPLPKRKVALKPGDQVYDKMLGAGVVLKERNAAFLRVQYKRKTVAYNYFEALALKSKL
jgi:hypothetical protein